MGIFNPRTWFKKKPSAEGEISTFSGLIPPNKPPSGDDNHLNRRPDPGGSEGQTLSDIVRGIAHAASAANEIQDRQFIQQVNQYFHKEADGTLVPKVVRAKIDDNTYMEVPLITMIDPSTIGLEEMEVRMGIRLSKSDVKEHVQNFNDQNKVSRSSFNVSLTSCKPGERQDVIDVTMKFKKTDPAEGSSRLIDEMNGTVQPHKYTKDTAKPSEFTHVFTSSNRIEKTVREPIDEGDEDTDELKPHDHKGDESEGIKPTDDSSDSSNSQS